MKQTPFGEFAKKNGMWEAFIEVEDPEFEDGEIRVAVADVQGEPNPQLLSFIPYIIANLPTLEQTARKAVSKLTAEHYLESVSDSNAPADFSLDFSYSEGDWCEAVCVGMKDGKVTDWYSGD